MIEYGLLHIGSFFLELELVLLIALVLTAALFDLISSRIPNWLIVAGLIISLAYQTVSGYGTGFSTWAAGLGVGFALFLPMYMLRAMGAGDVKLMAMVGAFIGAQSVLTATLYTLLAGGLLSLVFMLGRGVAAQTLANVRFLLTDWALRASSGQGARLAPLQTTAARLPYAVAIALGTGAALLWPLATP